MLSWYYVSCLQQYLLSVAQQGVKVLQQEANAAEQEENNIITVCYRVI